MSAPIAARPVAAIVGGTRGIGLAMGREWLKRHRYQSPKLFLLGRRVKDNSAISEMKTEFDDFYLHTSHFNHIVASVSPKNRQEK